MDLFSDRTILTVSRFTDILRDLLEENLSLVWVEGEVSNLSLPSSGHIYFTLKDAGAQVRCVIFRSTARNLRFRLADGMGIILRGRASVYPQRGEYQLVGEYLEPRGMGALQAAFEQLKERLAREGLFESCRKKPLPLLPQRIGIVTSPSGAAIHDILRVVERRFANVEVLLRPVRVQGEGASQEIAEAIRDFNRYGGVDVMIVGRGGGSLEDLWAFNEEEVARAICDSKIPVISAVGHEVDFTIADFVADLRAPTPSAAAEMVVLSKDELAARVGTLRERLEREMENTLGELRYRQESLAARLQDPRYLLGHLGQRVDDLQARMQAALGVSLARRRDAVQHSGRHLQLVNPALRVERCREQLVALSLGMENAVQSAMDRRREHAAVAGAKLDSLSPLTTLARGYSVTRRVPGGAIVRRGADLAAGERVEILFAAGSARCLVEDSSSDGGVDGKSRGNL